MDVYLDGAKFEEPELEYEEQLKSLTSLLNKSPVTFATLTDKLAQYVDEGGDLKLEVLLENQRGIKFFGIPLFSYNSLIPLIDPANFQNARGADVSLEYNNIMNYALPDLDWEWVWDSWYVLMFDDVDDQGWVYSKVFFNKRRWKGKYHFGNFVRRRVWTRLRRRKNSRDKKVLERAITSA